MPGYSLMNQECHKRPLDKLAFSLFYGGLADMPGYSLMKQEGHKPPPQQTSLLFDGGLADMPGCSCIKHEDHKLSPLIRQPFVFMEASSYVFDTGPETSFIFVLVGIGIFLCSLTERCIRKRTGQQLINSINSW